MAEPVLGFEEVARFHGHQCPGLAFGYRVSLLALNELVVDRSEDEELVAIVENNSCAVDAIQAMTGCTFGKGNFIFKDYGKQVYTFIRRSDGEVVRISVVWENDPELAETSEAWDRYRAGDRSPDVVKSVAESKKAKMQAILSADDAELFKLSHPDIQMPAQAQIFPTLKCVKCSEKVMAPRTTDSADGPVCIPCSDPSQLVRET